MLLMVKKCIRGGMLFIDMQKQIINTWYIMVKMENPCIVCTRI